MTEDEAKTKWCPMVRMDNAETEPSFNRNYGGSLPDGSNCIASDCIMWVVETSYGVNTAINVVTGGRCGLIR